MTKRITDLFLISSRFRLFNQSGTKEIQKMNSSNPNISWKEVLWINDGVYLSAAKVRKAVRNCVRTNPGEALSFDLYSFTNNAGTLVGALFQNLHWEWRGGRDNKKNFLAILNAEHEKISTAKFRVIGYCAEID